MMHGYRIQRFVASEKGVRLYTATPSEFDSGQFTKLPIAADIYAMSGKKKRSTRSRR
jgi:hypothetical protein